MIPCPEKFQLIQKWKIFELRTRRRFYEFDLEYTASCRFYYCPDSNLIE